MAKIHIDCEDAIAACEKALSKSEEKYWERLDQVEQEKSSNGWVNYQIIENLKNFYINKHKTIKNLMHGASYLQYKNRILVMDTQGEEFSLISEFLPNH